MKLEVELDTTQVRQAFNRLLKKRYVLLEGDWKNDHRDETQPSIQSDDRHSP